MNIISEEEISGDKILNIKEELDRRVKAAVEMINIDSNLPAVKIVNYSTDVQETSFNFGMTNFIESKLDIEYKEIRRFFDGENDEVEEWSDDIIRTIKISNAHENMSGLTTDVFDSINNIINVLVKEMNHIKYKEMLDNILNDFNEEGIMSDDNCIKFEIKMKDIIDKHFSDYTYDFNNKEVI